MRVSLTLLLSAALAGAVTVGGCESGTAAVEVPEGAVQLSTEEMPQEVADYLYTGIRDRRRLVITTEAEWTALWQEVTAPYQPQPPVPTIDFGAEQVVVVSMGSKNSGGYSIEIESVQEAEGKLYVTVREVSPGSNCMTTAAITSPVAAVRFAKRNATAVFVERAETHTC